MEFNKKIIQIGLAKVLEISEARCRTLELLKQVLIEDDDDKIKLYAKQLTGFPSEGYSISQGVNSGAGK